MIREAIVEHYSTPRQAYKGSGRISVSNFGRCIRSVMLSLSTPVATEFPFHVREVMDLGLAYEQSTETVLRERYGTSFKSQIPISNKIWSGKMDFVLNLPKEQPVIIEHKATGDKWFDYNCDLPKFEHVCQLWLYGQLYNEINHVRPKLILYYRAWGCHAEFELLSGAELDQGSGAAIGQVNGQKVKRPVAIETLSKRRDEYEQAYALLPCVPDIPCSTPCDAFGCTFRGAKSCAYYEQCWGEK